MGQRGQTYEHGIAEETARDARESKAANEGDGFMTRYADRVFLVDLIENLGSYIENT